MLAGSSLKTSGAGPLQLDRYLIEERIGRGGMADVFRGKLTRVGGFVRDVAVKVLLPQLAGESEFINMLMDEARIAATINHTNVVQVLDVGQQGETFYLVMEYIDGTDLRSVERRHESGAVPLMPLLFIIAEVLRGLSAIHGACDASGAPLRVIHRDVTPSNVLITRSGTVKLADFGIAHATGRLTHTQHGAVKGKTRYMAPEQLEGGTIDHRSDLFAVGVVFLEALLGRSGADAWHSTGMGPIFRLPARIPAGLPVEVERLLRRALTEKPEDRYPSAMAFRRDVLRALRARCAERGDEVDFAADELAAFLAEVLSHPDPRFAPRAEAESSPPLGGSPPSESLTLGSAAAEEQVSQLSQRTQPRAPGPVVDPRGAAAPHDEAAAPPASVEVEPRPSDLPRGPASALPSDLVTTWVTGNTATPTMLLPQVSAGAGRMPPAPDISQDSTAISQASVLLRQSMGADSFGGAAVFEDVETVPRGPQPGDLSAQGAYLRHVPRELLQDPMAAPLWEEGTTGVARRAARGTLGKTLVGLSAQRRSRLRTAVLVLLGATLLYLGYLLMKALAARPA